MNQLTNSPNTGRRKLREIVLKMLFSYYFFQKNSPNKLDSIVSNFEQNLASILETDYAKISLSPSDKDFLAYIFNGVTNNQVNINKIMTAHLNKISIDKVYIIDFIILQIAIFEILSQKDPIEIITNEAGILADKYSKDSSKKFINGNLLHIENNYNLWWPLPNVKL